MSISLPPVPRQAKPGDFIWDDWFNTVVRVLSSLVTTFTSYLPYTGALSNLNMGTKSITTAGLTSTAAVQGTTVKATVVGGFTSSDGSAGYTGTVTTALLVGKTITFKDGLVTGFA